MLFITSSINSAVCFCNLDERNVRRELDELLNDLLNGKTSAQEISTSHVLVDVKERVRLREKTLLNSSRTAALWLQYMKMVDILRAFIRAERTSNWDLHLRSLSEMLPYLAAAGHNLYVKCGRIYLQEMANLPRDHPDVHEKFMSGYHSVRRSNRFWAGLSTDLIIEQVLMRSIKTSGGLTRGKGITEHQRLVWLLSMPVCSEINRVMQSLSGINFNSGEQNKDISKARIQRDMKDTLKILTALNERNPFHDEEPVLRNIMTGVNADNNVNVDSARDVGKQILSSMTGESVNSYSFKRSAQAVTMASKSSLKIDGDVVQVDPLLLFQRLIIACPSAEDLPRVFQFELASYPTALFQSPSMMNPAQKPVLADAIWSQLSHKAKIGPSGQVHYVLDGGALLHRVPWPKATYKDVLNAYCSYVTRKYSKATVVFDGYDNATTKYGTQKRRAGGKVFATVSFNEEMQVTMKREEFLSNAKNKQRLILFLSEALRRCGCETIQAPADADLLIVMTTVEYGRRTPTVLVGDDTDLLILLCHHVDLNGFDVFLRPEPKRNAKATRVWNINETKQQLSPEICQHILFIHALLGCDTTSRVYGIGKAAALKKFQSNPYFREQALVFDDSTSSQEDITIAGENALVCLYGGKRGTKLDHLRYLKYCEKLASKKTQVHPQNLPPTSSAAQYHSLRVQLQIKQWKGQEKGMVLQDWGWLEQENQVIPKMTDKPAAPDSLLKIIRCNCQGDCSSRRCTCRRHGLECSPVCGQCKGAGCTNSQMDQDEYTEDFEALGP